MKKLLLLSFILLSLASYASHTGVSFLTYDYIGDSTGVPHQYEVKFSYFTDAASGFNISTSGVTLYIFSSCYSDQQATLTYIPATNPHPLDSNANLISLNYSCANTAYDYAVYKFEGTVTLPGTCNDFELAASGVCCIIPVQNIVQSDILNTAYASLDNSSKEYDMPEPDLRVLQAKLCINKKVSIEQPVAFDSVLSNFSVIDLINPINQYLYTWSGSFSPSNPFPTDSTGFTMLPDGTFSFVPKQIGNFIIPMEYQLYDTAGGSPHLVGTLNYAFLVEVVSVCDTGVVKGPDFHFQNKASWETALCSDSSLILHHSNSWNAGSLSSDYSEFKVSYANRNITIPVKRVDLLDSNRLKLVFTDSLGINDTLTVTTQSGSDGDGLLNYCSFDQNKPDTLKVAVVGCINVSQREAPILNKLQVYPNPANNQLSLNDPLQRRIAKVLITDAQGRSVREIQEPDNHFSLSRFSSGLFWFTFSFEDGSKETHKVMIW